MKKLLRVGGALTPGPGPAFFILHGYYKANKKRIRHDVVERWIAEEWINPRSLMLTDKGRAALAEGREKYETTAPPWLAAKIAACHNPKEES